MTEEKDIRLALVDDHALFRKGLKSLIQQLDARYSFLFEANNGSVMIEQLDETNMLDIVLLDINMPVMDGFKSIEWLRKHHKNVKILVVSMIQDEATILRIIKLGVRGYVPKDVEPEVLHKALMDIYHGHYHFTDLITGKLVDALNSLEQPSKTEHPWNINDREMDFMKLACSEMTYQQIADQMCVSPKTVDGYRKSLFEKLNLKSRVGLVMFAIKHGWAKV